MSVLRRTDETRRVIIIITTECLLAVLNSWLIDIILSVLYCGRSLAIGDDCPSFLRRYHLLLAFFDLLNSMSNIILYCFAARRFRHELVRMIKLWLETIRKRCPCFLCCLWNQTKVTNQNCSDKGYLGHSETSTRRFPALKRQTKSKYDYIELHIVTTPDTID